MSLDKAAEMVGISRKTLDDYNLQLKRAEVYKFDFEKHKHDKMGILRKFVKENMELDMKIIENKLIRRLRK